MKKLSIALGVITLLAFLGLSLLTGLTTARAGMFQAQANVAQATANTIQSTTTLVSQCLTGLMIIVALVGGIVMGYGFHAWRFILQKIPAHTLQREAGQNWLPGPNAQWGRRVNMHTTQLARPGLPQGLLNMPPLPTETLSTHALIMADLDENYDVEEEFIGSQWGF